MKQRQIVSSVLADAAIAFVCDLQNLAVLKLDRSFLSDKLFRQIGPLGKLTTRVVSLFWGNKKRASLC